MSFRKLKTCHRVGLRAYVKRVAARTLFSRLLKEKTVGPQIFGLDFAQARAKSQEPFDLFIKRAKLHYTTLAALVFAVLPFSVTLYASENILSDCQNQITIAVSEGAQSEALLENKKEFSLAGKTGYVTAYNAGIIYYSGWQEVAEMHIHAMKLNAKGAGAVIIDAGGGTGRMAQKVMQAYPEAKVIILDANKDMEAYALSNGIPADRIHVSDITDMRLGATKTDTGKKIPDESVDHIYSHSVLWMLESPEPFLKEASRVLKSGRDLSVSSFLPTMADPLFRGAFVSKLEFDMQNAFQSGKISEQVRDIMINANKTITRKQNHTYIELDQLSAIAKKHDLTLTQSNRDIYQGTFFFVDFEKE